MAKKLPPIKLGDLVQRVPKDQMEQFLKFRNKTLEYHRRVNQYPDKLPHVDWDFFRNNVRQDCIKMVDHFRIKYEELDQAFAGRHAVLDYHKYYKDLDTFESELEGEVQAFKDKSNARISEYEKEIQRLRSLIPYEDMTVEQFIIMREDISDFIPRQGKPLFWPHTEDEQRLGPVNPKFAEELKKQEEGTNEH